MDSTFLPGAPPCREALLDAKSKRFAHGELRIKHVITRISL